MLYEGGHGLQRDALLLSMTTLGLTAEPPEAGALVQAGHNNNVNHHKKPNGNTVNGTGWQSENGSAHGKKLVKYTVNPDVQTNKIFIGGVPAEATKRDVRHTFIKFGQIKEALLPRDPRDRGRHRGFAFVSFGKASSVDEVLKDGPKVHKVCGRVVECKRAIPHPTKGIINGACRRLRTSDHRIIPAEFEAGYKNNLYVTGLPADVTKKEVEELFGTCGDLLSTKLGRSEGHQRTAFVAFLEEERAAKAMRELTGKNMRGGVLNVTYAYHVTRHPRKPKFHPNSKKGPGGNAMNGIPHPQREQGYHQSKWGWQPKMQNGYEAIMETPKRGRGRGKKNHHYNLGIDDGRHGQHIPPMYYNVMMPHTPTHGATNANGKQQRKKNKNALPEIPHVDPLSRSGRNGKGEKTVFAFSAEKVMEAQMRLKQAHDGSFRQHPGDAWHLKSRSNALGENGNPELQTIANDVTQTMCLNAHGQIVANGQQRDTKQSADAGAMAHTQQWQHYGVSPSNGMPPTAVSAAHAEQMAAYHQSVARSGFDMQQMAAHPVMLPPTHMPNVTNAVYCTPQSFYYSPYAYPDAGLNLHSPQHQPYGPTTYGSVHSPHPSYSLHDTSHQSQLSSSNSAMVQNSNGVYTFPSNGANGGAGSLTSSEKPSPPQSPAVESDGSQSNGAARSAVDDLLQKLWRLTLRILDRSPANEDLEWKQLRPVLKAEATAQFGESSWRSANTMGLDGWTVLKRLKVRLRNRPKKESGHNTANGTANGTNGIAEAEPNAPETTTADEPGAALVKRHNT